MTGKRVRVVGYSEPTPGIRHDEDFSSGEHFLPAVSGAAGISAVNEGGYIRRTTITLAALNMATVDNTTNGAQGNQKLLDFPVGAIMVLGASFALDAVRVGTNITATAALIMSVGSTVPGTDATLTGTEADVISSTAMTMTAGDSGIVKKGASASAYLDGSASAKSLYLNADIPDAGSAGADALTITGTVEIFWIHLGNET